MLRTALRPASLGLLAIMLVAATLFAGLGHWQLDRAHRRGAPARTEHVVALGTVLAPAAPFTSRADHQLVRATGRWVAQDTVLVAGRSLGGREGSYVVTALRVTSGGSSGGSGAAGAAGAGLLPVVRGWVPRGTPASAVPAPPTGEVRVVGRLMVSEDPAGVGPHGSVSALSSADLINVWRPPLYTGYLLASRAPAPLRVVPAPVLSRHLDLQNLSYAFQWWLFAVFALLLWGKTVKDRHAADREALEGPEPDEASEAGEQQDRSGGGVGGDCEDGPQPVGAGAGARPAPRPVPQPDPQPSREVPS